MDKNMLIFIALFLAILGVGGFLAVKNRSVGFEANIERGTQNNVQ